MTAAQQIEQRGFIKGYLASYATRYAADVALRKMDEECRLTRAVERPETGERK